MPAILLVPSSQHTSTSHPPPTHRLYHCTCAPQTGCEANFLFKNVRSNVSGHRPETKDRPAKNGSAKKRKGKRKGGAGE